jgi:hypothetical protein
MRRKVAVVRVILGGAYVDVRTGLFVPAGGLTM